MFLSNFNKIFYGNEENNGNGKNDGNVDVTTTKTKDIAVENVQKATELLRKTKEANLIYEQIKGLTAQKDKLKAAQENQLSVKNEKEKKRLEEECKKEIKRLNADLADKMEKIAEIKAESDRLAKEAKVDCEQKIKSEADKAEEARKSLLEANAATNLANQKLQELKRQLEDCEKNKGKSATDLGAQILDLQNKLTECKDKGQNAEALNGQIQGLQNELKDCKEKDAEILRLQNELKNCKEKDAKIIELQGQIEALKEKEKECDKKQREIEELKRQQQEIEKKCAENKNSNNNNNDNSSSSKDKTHSTDDDNSSKNQVFSNDNLTSNAVNSIGMVSNPINYEFIDYKTDLTDDTKKNILKKIIEKYRFFKKIITIFYTTQNKIDVNFNNIINNNIDNEIKIRLGSSNTNIIKSIKELLEFIQSTVDDDDDDAKGKIPEFLKSSAGNGYVNIIPLLNILTNLIQEFLSIPKNIVISRIIKDKDKVSEKTTRIDYKFDKITENLTIKITKIIDDFVVDSNITFTDVYEYASKYRDIRKNILDECPKTNNDFNKNLVIDDHKIRDRNENIKVSDLECGLTFKEVNTYIRDGRVVFMIGFGNSGSGKSYVFFGNDSKEGFFLQTLNNLKIDNKYSTKIIIKDICEVGTELDTTDLKDTLFGNDSYYEDPNNSTITFHDIITNIDDGIIELLDKFEDEEIKKHSSGTGNKNDVDYMLNHYKIYKKSEMYIEVCDPFINTIDKSEGLISYLRSFEASNFTKIENNKYLPSGFSPRELYTKYEYILPKIRTTYYNIVKKIDEMIKPPAKTKSYGEKEKEVDEHKVRMNIINTDIQEKLINKIREYMTNYEKNTSAITTKYSDMKKYIKNKLETNIVEIVTSFDDKEKFLNIIKTNILENVNVTLGNETVNKNTRGNGGVLSENKKRERGEKSTKLIQKPSSTPNPTPDSITKPIIKPITKTDTIIDKIKEIYEELLEEKRKKENEQSKMLGRIPDWFNKGIIKYIYQNQNQSNNNNNNSDVLKKINEFDDKYNNNDNNNDNNNNNNLLLNLHNEITALRKKEKRILKTVYNPESSRSHLIYRFEIRSVNKNTNNANNASNKESVGYLVVVDLAGKEDVNKIVTESFKQLLLSPYGYITSDLEQKEQGEVMKLNLDLDKENKEELFNKIEIYLNDILNNNKANTPNKDKIINKALARLPLEIVKDINVYKSYIKKKVDNGTQLKKFILEMMQLIFQGYGLINPSLEVLKTYLKQLMYKRMINVVNDNFSNASSKDIEKEKEEIDKNTYKGEQMGIIKIIERFINERNEGITEKTSGSFIADLEKRNTPKFIIMSNLRDDIEDINYIEESFPLHTKNNTKKK